MYSRVPWKDLFSPEHFFIPHSAFRFPLSAFRFPLSDLLISLRLDFKQMSVLTILLHQFLVRAAFNDLAFR